MTFCSPLKPEGCFFAAQKSDRIWLGSGRFLSDWGLRAYPTGSVSRKGSESAS